MPTPGRITRRDGEWSGCESISQFELSVTREKAVGENVQGLVIQDASIPDGGPIPGRFSWATLTGTYHR